MSSVDARTRIRGIVNIGGMTARIVAPLRITNGIVNAGVSNFTKQLANQVRTASPSTVHRIYRN